MIVERDARVVHRSGDAAISRPAHARSIDPENERSLALAERAGFVRWGDVDGNPYWKLVVRGLA